MMPADVRSNSALHNGMYLFYAFALLLAVGGFNLQLSGFDTREALKPDAASLVSQVLFALIYFAVTLHLMNSSRGRAVALKAWPIFVLPVLALISSAWSPDPALTFRRGVAFIGTVIFGVALGATFSLRDCITLVTRVLAAAMLLSVVWVILFPAYGIHQAYESYPFQSVHAGMWRGIFAHRNVLGGFVGGLTFGLVIVYGRYAFKNIILRVGAIVVTIACLLGANSGSGYLLAVMIPGILIVLSVIARQNQRIRLQLVASLFLFTIFVGAFFDEIVAFGLWALDKAPDFTGRVPYWNLILETMDDSPIYGYGYFAGFAVLIGPRINNATDMSAIAPHSGYLDLLVAFGYVGLIIGIAVLLWASVRAINLVLFGTTRSGYLNAFPLCIVAFVIIHNVVESTLMLANNIVVVMLATAMATTARASADSMPVPGSTKAKRPKLGSARTAQRKPA